MKGFIADGHRWAYKCVSYGVVCGAFCAAPLLPTHGQDVSAIFSQSGTQHWNNADVWDDGLDPSSGKTYGTAAFDIRTPTISAPSVFGGDSLSIMSGGRLILKQNYVADNVATANLIMDGGGIFSGTSTTTGEQQRLAGSIVFLAATPFNLSESSRRRVGLYSNVLSGSGNVTINGKNTDDILLIDGTTTSSHTGNWTINGGRLIAFLDEHIHTLASVSLVNANSFLDIRSAQEIGSLEGAGGVNAGSAGSFVLTTGGNDLSTAYGGIISNGSGTVGLTKTGSGMFTLTGANSYTGVTTISQGTLQLGNGGTFGSITDSASIINNAALLINRNNTTTINGTISGTGTLTMTGGGTLALAGSGTNSYTGITTVESGTIQAGKASAFGAIGNTIFVNSGGTVNVNGQAMNARQYVFNIQGDGAAGTGALINTAGEQQNAVKFVTLTGDASIGGSGRFDIRSSGGGSVLNVGAHTLTKKGNNKIVLVDGSLVGTGTIVVESGILTLTRSSLPTGNPISVMAGATLQIENHNTTAVVSKPVVLSNSSLQLSGNSMSLASPITVNNISTVNVATGLTLTSTGGVSGTGTLTKTSPGVLLLSAASSHTGGTDVVAGTLRVGNTQALGPNNSAISVQAGGTVDLNGTQTVSRDYSLTISGSGVGNSGAIINSGASHNHGFRFITLAGNATIGGTGRFDMRPTVGLASQLDLDSFTLTKTGSNLIALVGDEAAGGAVIGSGNIVVNQGALTFTRLSVTGGGGIFVNAGARLEVENHNNLLEISTPIHLNNGTFYLKGGPVEVTLDSPVNLTVGNTVQVDTGRTLVAAGDWTGTGGFTKSLGGTLRLRGDNTYQGSTIVQTGRLELVDAASVNSISQSALIDVRVGATLDVQGLTGGVLHLASGQTLTGAGSVQGGLIVGAGAAISPGASPGTLVTGTQEWEGGGFYHFELDRVDPLSISQAVFQGTNDGADWLDIRGALTVSSSSSNPFTVRIYPLNISDVSGAVTDWNPFGEYAWTIASANSGVFGFTDGAITVDASPFQSFHAIPSDRQFSVTSSGDDIVLQYGIIPEPSSLVLLFVGFACSYVLNTRRLRRNSER